MGQQERHWQVAPAAQPLRINPLRLIAIRTAIDYKINDSVEIKLLAIDLIRNAREILRLHQLKLMPDRRDDTLVPFLREIHEVAIAMLHLLLDNPTPANPMIGQLSIPLVVVVRNLA